MALRLFMCTIQGTIPHQANVKCAVCNYRLKSYARVIQSRKIKKKSGKAGDID